MSNGIDLASRLAASVNGAKGGLRYTVAAEALAEFLKGVQLSHEDKLDLLADLSDLVDGIQPHPKSKLFCK